MGGRETGVINAGPFATSSKRFNTDTIYCVCDPVHAQSRGTPRASVVRRLAAVARRLSRRKRRARSHVRGTRRRRAAVAQRHHRVVRDSRRRSPSRRRAPRCGGARRGARCPRRRRPRHRRAAADADAGTVGSGVPAARLGDIEVLSPDALPSRSTERRAAPPARPHHRNRRPRLPRDGRRHPPSHLGGSGDRGHHARDRHRSADPSSGSRSDRSFAPAASRALRAGCARDGLVAAGRRGARPRAPARAHPVRRGVGQAWGRRRAEPPGPRRSERAGS